MSAKDCHRPVAVIEDDQVSRHALGRLLMAGGFESELFESAELFIAAKPETPWLCLIVDVQLTGMSGLNLQQSLRATGSVVPMIITTGAENERIRESAEREGCVAVLWKPYSPDTILALLDSLSRPTHT